VLIGAISVAIVVLLAAVLRALPERLRPAVLRPKPAAEGGSVEAPDSTDAGRPTL
jgi:hypothetical protein